MWCPDVYEGAPTPFTAYLSVAPKAAGFAVALRVFFGGMAYVPTGELDQVAKIAADVPWPAILGVVAAVTMTLGNFAAINQNNLKRLLAYSSIAHAGYIMMGVACASNMGNMSVLVYLSFYLLMNVGAFLVVEMVSRAGGSESIFEYRGLARRAPFAAVAFAILLFSLTGLPPLAGFIGKFYLFYAVIQKAGAVSAAGGDPAGWWTLAVVGVLNSALSLYYYARVVKAMFLEKGDTERPLEFPMAYTGLLAGLTALVLVFGVYWAPISEAAANAIKSMAG
jgi:NADH-quinone oxidoreductase subunit N